MDWDRKWFVYFRAGKTQLISFERSSSTGALDVKKNGSVLEEKSSFKMLGRTISVAKTASEKVGALIRSTKFLSPEVALYLCKSTMKCCCHVWADAPSCYLELLDKLQKLICRTVGPSLTASLEPLVHRRHIVSLSLFYRYLAKVLLNWLNWFHFLILVEFYSLF